MGLLGKCDPDGALLEMNGGCIKKRHLAACLQKKYNMLKLNKKWIRFLTTVVPLDIVEEIFF